MCDYVLTVDCVEPRRTQVPSVPASALPAAGKVTEFKIYLGSTMVVRSSAMLASFDDSAILKFSRYIVNFSPP